MKNIIMFSAILFFFFNNTQAFNYQPFSNSFNYSNPNDFYHVSNSFQTCINNNCNINSNNINFNNFNNLLNKKLGFLNNEFPIHNQLKINKPIINKKNLENLDIKIKNIVKSRIKKLETILLDTELSEHDYYYIVSIKNISKLELTKKDFQVKIENSKIIILVDKKINKSKQYLKQEFEITKNVYTDNIMITKEKDNVYVWVKKMKY